MNDRPPRLILGDCLVEMAGIEDGSVDLIAADLPYGITQCRWDEVIPFGPLWGHYCRVLKPRGAVVLTASQPFTSMLVMSNPKWFRYELIWKKDKTTGHLDARRKPLRAHESVLIFARGRTTYHPQITDKPARDVRPATRADTPTSCYGAFSHHAPRTISVHRKYPTSIVAIPCTNHGERGLHPTQKPVALMEYLVRTYSNPGDVVLDNCMGSGTTGLACLNTDRSFIGIERDPVYFAVASRRLAETAASTPLFSGEILTAP